MPKYNHLAVSRTIERTTGSRVLYTTAQSVVATSPSRSHELRVALQRLPEAQDTIDRAAIHGLAEASGFLPASLALTFPYRRSFPERSRWGPSSWRPGAAGFERCSSSAAASSDRQWDSVSKPGLAAVQVDACPECFQDPLPAGPAGSVGFEVTTCCCPCRHPAANVEIALQRHAPELWSVKYSVMSREALIDERVVGGEQIDELRSSRMMLSKNIWVSVRIAWRRLSSKSG